MEKEIEDQIKEEGEALERVIKKYGIKSIHITSFMEGTPENVLKGLKTNKELY